MLGNAVRRTGRSISVRFLPLEWETLLDIVLMESIATQMMEGSQVEVAGKAVPLRRTSYQRLKTLTFVMDGREYQAIEQNADKPSRWGQLARAGHQVVQFRDAQTGRYVAVSVDGKVKEYGG
jgi:hypothetical protein